MRSTCSWKKANLHRVADPAAGSGTFEAITEGLCESAWSAFQAIEGAGGILEAISAGWVADAIASARAAAPAPAIVGTNRFAADAEDAGHVLIPATGSADIGQGILPPRRDAAAFEEASS